MTVDKIIETYRYYEKIDNTSSMVKISPEALKCFEKIFNANSRVLYARVRTKPITGTEDQTTGTEVQTKETIMGVVTDGSINVDGKSAARRTCNLTLVSEDISNINKANWALKNKFSLELGIEVPSEIFWGDQTEYIKWLADDNNIIWFPQGEFYITSFSAALSTNSFRISISGQDKMAKLNGTIGGTITTQIDLSKYDQLNEKGEVISTEVLTLDTIVKNLVVTYGDEEEDNIIIQDLSEEEAANLLEYRGTSPLYLLLASELNEKKKRSVITLTTYGKQKCIENGSDTTTTLDNLSSYYISEDNMGNTIRLKKDSTTTYYCQKIEYGQTVGYEPTKLIYPGELIAEIGSAITAALDKIKNIYTNYEYYYDVFGRFIFKKQSSYCETTYPEYSEGELSISLKNYPSEVAWRFLDLKLYTSLNNNPAIGELKNDFTVWGKRKSTSGEMPVHMRVAFQSKPTSYTPVYQLNDQEEIIENSSNVTYTNNEYDWREIIYQMALDENRAKQKWGTKWSQAIWRKAVVKKNGSTYPTGITDCEDFYLDMLTYWRDLYDINNPSEFIATTPDDRAPQKNTENTLVDGTIQVKNLYLPYQDSEVTLDDEADFNLDNYYKTITIDDKNYVVKWIDQFNIAKAYPNSNIYGLYNNEVIDLEEKIDLSKQAVYYYEGGEWKRPYEHYISNNEELKKIYYASATSPADKKLLILSGDIRYRNLNKTTLLDGAPLSIRKYNEDGSVSEYKINNIVIDGKEIEITGKADLEHLQVAIANNKEITITTPDPNNSEGTTEIKYTPENQVIAVDYWSKEQLDDTDIEYYQKTDEERKIVYGYLIDKIIEENNSKMFRRNFYFKSSRTEVKEYKEGDNDSITNDESKQIITKVDKEKKTTTTITNNFSSILNSLVFDKKQLYTKDGDIFKLVNYKQYMMKDNPLIYRNQETYGVYPYPTSPSGQPVDFPLSKKTPIYDYLGNITGMIDEPIICYYRYYPYGLPDSGKDSYWNVEYKDNPYNKLFWLEFIDADGEWYSGYAKEKIGKRQKAINDSNVTALDYSITPGLELGTVEKPLPDAYKKYFIVARRGKSAKEAIDELLFKHTYITENISASILPLYFLEPNTIIEIRDSENTTINNYYSINSFSLPLNYSATMSLNLTKIFGYSDSNKQ